MCAPSPTGFIARAAVYFSAAFSNCLAANKALPSALSGAASATSDMALSPASSVACPSSRRAWSFILRGVLLGSRARPARQVASHLANERPSIVPRSSLAGCSSGPSRASWSSSHLVLGFASASFHLARALIKHSSAVAWRRKPLAHVGAMVVHLVAASTAFAAASTTSPGFHLTLESSMYDAQRLA